MRKDHITVTAISVLIALLAGFTGCNSNETSSVSQSSISTPESTVESTDNCKISESVPEQRFSDVQLEMISGLKKQSFEGPDGETVQAADAIDVYKYDDHGKVYDNDMDLEDMDLEWVDTFLKYDFAYIDYAKSYCNFVIENDDTAADYSKALEWQEELSALQTEREWRKVKAGDVLENGLTVLKAECEVLPTLKTDYYSMAIQLDGEFTMEGVLSFREKDDYLLSEGETIFNPDAVKTAGVPLIFNGSTTDSSGYYTVSALTGGYIVCDGQSMRLGLLDDLNIDGNEIFGDKNCAHVKTTFRNPEFHTDNRTDQMQAAFIELGGEIVSIELIDA